MKKASSLLNPRVTVSFLRDPLTNFVKMEFSMARHDFVTPSDRDARDRLADWFRRGITCPLFPFFRRPVVIEAANPSESRNARVHGVSRRRPRSSQAKNRMFEETRRKNGNEAFERAKYIYFGGRCCLPGTGGREIESVIGRPS